MKRNKVLIGRLNARNGGSDNHPCSGMRYPKPNTPRHDCTWLIYTLTVAGSYLQDIARPVTGAPDTFQCWITPKKFFDVRTFSIDKDVRVLDCAYEGRLSDPVEFVQEMALEIYGDIIEHIYRITAQPGEPIEQLREKVRALGLHPNVRKTRLGFPLWLPEDARYWSQSADQE